MVCVFMSEYQLYIFVCNTQLYLSLEQRECQQKCFFTIFRAYSDRGLSVHIDQ